MTGYQREPDESTPRCTTEAAVRTARRILDRRRSAWISRAGTTRTPLVTDRTSPGEAPDDAPAPLAREAPADAPRCATLAPSPGGAAHRSARGVLPGSEICGDAASGARMTHRNAQWVEGIGYNRDHVQSLHISDWDQRPRGVASTSGPRNFSPRISPAVASISAGRGCWWLRSFSELSQPACNKPSRVRRGLEGWTRYALAAAGVSDHGGLQTASALTHPPPRARTGTPPSCHSPNASRTYRGSTHQRTSQRCGPSRPPRP